MSTLNSLVLSGSTYDLTSGPVPEVVKEALKVEDIVLSEDAFEDAYGKEVLEAVKALGVIDNSAPTVEQHKEEQMEAKAEQIIKVALGSRFLRISRGRLEGLGEDGQSNLKLLGQELPLEVFVQKATKGLVGQVLVRVASLVPEPAPKPEVKPAPKPEVKPEVKVETKVETHKATGWKEVPANSLLTKLEFPGEVDDRLLAGLKVEVNTGLKAIRFRVDARGGVTYAEGRAFMKVLRNHAYTKGFSPGLRYKGWDCTITKS